MAYINNGLEKFGHREIEQAIALLTAYRDKRLPDNWDDTDVHLDFNHFNGLVCISNNSYQCAFIHSEYGLAISHTTPYDNKEGVLPELVDNFLENESEWYVIEDREYLLRHMAYETLYYSDKENGHDIVAKFNVATKKLMQAIAQSYIDDVIDLIEQFNPNIAELVADDDWLSEAYHEYAEYLFDEVDNPANYAGYDDIGVWFVGKLKEAFALPATP